MTHETEHCHGYLARSRGEGIATNPYAEGTPEAMAWAEGWRDADIDSVPDRIY